MFDKCLCYNWNAVESIKHAQYSALRLVCCYCFETPVNLYIFLIFLTLENRSTMFCMRRLMLSYFSKLIWIGININSSHFRDGSCNFQIMFHESSIFSSVFYILNKSLISHTNKNYELISIIYITAVKDKLSIQF